MITTFKPITPSRYVYHVSYKMARESIFKKGLLGFKQGYYKNSPFKKAVFAHNKSIPNLDWYPFILDHYDWMSHNDYNVQFEDYYDYFKFKCMQLGYDFWQIDTSKLSGQWYIDQVAMNDFMGGMEYPYYIVYEGDIPVNALKLYNFFEYPLVKTRRGVSHIISDFREVA